MTSIHRKITLTYLLMAAVIAGLSVFTLVDLIFLQRQVHVGVAVADFKEATLEMRRWEKNLFLYADPQTNTEILLYLQTATAILENKRSDFALFADATMLSDLNAALSGYAALLAQYQLKAPGLNREQAENSIRATGHKISSQANELARRERDILAETISRSRTGLIVSILIVVMLVIGIGYRLAHMVVKPLQRLEADLAPIAAGQLDHLEVASNDRELVAFASAFNRMLTEMESRRRRLLQSEKLAALGILAAGVAHEVNNPLSNISSSGQLLMEELDTASPERLHEWAKQIVDETERAHRIITALLEFGKKNDFELKPVALADVVEKTLLLLKGPLRTAKATVTTDIPKDLFILADTQRLQQVFINVIHNAMQSADSGINIVLRAAYCADPLHSLPTDVQVIGDVDCGNDPKVQIEIADDGHGIPADTLTKIFMPFFTTRELGRGMGLGLYIVHDIIKEHHGCIAVSSQPGHGTRVFIYLPYQKGQA